MHVVIDREARKIVFHSQDSELAARASLNIPATRRIVAFSPDYADIGVLSSTELRAVLVNTRKCDLNAVENDSRFVKLALIKLFNELNATPEPAMPAVTEALFNLDSKRPKSHTTSGAVWAMCDELVGKSEGSVKWASVREQLLAACRLRGIADGTVRTQFVQYKRAYDNAKNTPSLPL